MNKTLLRGASLRALCGPMTAAELATGRYMRGPDHPDDSKSVEDLAKEVKADFDKRFETILQREIDKRRQALVEHCCDQQYCISPERL